MSRLDFSGKFIFNKLAQFLEFDNTNSELDSSNVQDALEELAFLDTQTIFVFKNGNDTTGNGSQSKPFASLGRAVTAILDGDFAQGSGNQVAIIMGAGEFDQAPVDASSIDNLTIIGKGPKTRINATNVNADLLKVGTNATLNSIALGGVTASDKYNLVISTANGGLASTVNLRIQGGSNGINHVNTSGTLRVTHNNPLLGSNTGSIINTTDNTIVTLNSVVVIGTTVSTKAIVQNGNSQIFLFGGRFTTCNTAIEVNGDTGTILISAITAPSTEKALVQNGDSLVEVIGGNFDVTSSQITDTSKLEGYFFNELPEENQLRVISELSVGLPNRGRETSLGKGDSYVTGMQVWTETSGNVFTNVTTNASSPTGSTFTFPANTANNSIYISTAFDILSPLKFYGIKSVIDTASALGAGDIVFEYYDGTSWVEFNHMIVDSGPPFLSYANDKMTNTGGFQIYFDTELNNDWAVNDPVGLGVNLYWVRLRISSTVTTAPIFEQFKIHTDRMEIDVDGTQLLYGTGRIKEKFPVTYTGLAGGAGRTPNSQDAYLSDNLAIGFQNNSFPSNQNRSSIFTQFIPFEIDTSSPIEITLSYYVNSNTSGGVVFRVRWATQLNGEGVYSSSSDAPTTAPNERTVDNTITIGANEENIKKIKTTSLEIPEAISQQSDGAPQSQLWLQITRLTNDAADTYNGDVIITDLAIFYTAWREGGYTG